MISVAIPSLNFCGGAETTLLALIRLLKSKNYKVKLITSDKTDWNKIRELFGYNTLPDKEVYGINYDITKDISTLKVLKMLKVFKDLIKEEDMLINMYGNLDIFLGYGDIVYIQSMPFSIIRREKAPMYMNYLTQKIYNLTKFFYPKPNNIIISNSKYTSNIIKERLNLESFVIHPPPATIIDNIDLPKENIVLTISRIASGKKLDKVLYIAKMLRGLDVRFVIIGRVYDYKYYSRLLELKNVLDLDNITFITNSSRDTLLEYLARSKVILHTTDHEEYGLSIIEGMLAKCIPVVPMNGGPWVDILDSQNGVYGYAYSSIEDASNIINNLINNCDVLTKGKLAMERAKILSNEFYELFPLVLNKYWLCRNHQSLNDYYQ